MPFNFITRITRITPTTLTPENGAPYARHHPQSKT